MAILLLTINNEKFAIAIRESVFIHVRFSMYFKLTLYSHTSSFTEYVFDTQIVL